MTKGLWRKLVLGDEAREGDGIGSCSRVFPNTKFGSADTTHIPSFSTLPSRRTEAITCDCIPVMVIHPLG